MGFVVWCGDGRSNAHGPWTMVMPQPPGKGSGHSLWLWLWLWRLHTDYWMALPVCQ
jgi:hypothetical protein